MNKNLDRLLEKLKVEADLIDKIHLTSNFRYKSIQSLILAHGKPFVRKANSPFKGKPQSCFENCFKALWDFPNLSYCEGFAIDDDLNLAISHAWLVNNSLEVIDPTWIGKKFKGSIYFGVVFNREFVMEMAEITRSYGILDSDYMNEHKLKREGFPPSALHPIFHSIEQV